MLGAGGMTDGSFADCALPNTVAKAKEIKPKIFFIIYYSPLKNVVLLIRFGIYFKLYPIRNIIGCVLGTC